MDRPTWQRLDSTVRCSVFSPVSPSMPPTVDYQCPRPWHLSYATRLNRGTLTSARCCTFDSVSIFPYIYLYYPMVLLVKPPSNACFPSYLIRDRHA